MTGLYDYRDEIADAMDAPDAYDDRPTRAEVEADEHPTGGGHRG